MNQLVVLENDRAVTTSISVSSNFQKRHDHVLRDVENLKKDIPNFGEMFFETRTPDSYGRPRKTFFMNRDGFTILAMGFTGKEATQFKLKYIEAFNQMEKELNVPKSQLEVLQGTINQLVEQDKKLNQIEGQVNNISNIVTMTSDEWREKVKVILRKIARNWTGVEPYRSVIKLSYERFEKRAGCKLDIRLNNRKERALAQGMTKSYIQKINKLDCIAEEKRLVEIYIQVVKEMAIEFKIDINDFKFEGVI